MSIFVNQFGCDLEAHAQANTTREVWIFQDIAMDYVCLTSQGIVLWNSTSKGTMTERDNFKILQKTKVLIELVHNTS